MVMDLLYYWKAGRKLGIYAEVSLGLGVQDFTINLELIEKTARNWNLGCSVTLKVWAW